MNKYLKMLAIIFAILVIIFAIKLREIIDANTEFVLENENKYILDYHKLIDVGRTVWQVIIIIMK